MRKGEEISELEQLEVEKEGERCEEGDAWEVKLNRAQECIGKLEEENTKSRKAMSQSEHVEEEQKAAKFISEGKAKGRREDQIAEAKKRSPPSERKI